MNTNKAVVNIGLNTYLPNNKVIPTLKSILALENEINIHYGCDNELNIIYYGLQLDVNDLNNEAKFLAKIKDHTSELRVKYSDHSKQRKKPTKDNKDTNNYTFYEGELKQCIKTAIHSARNECLVSMDMGEEWYLKNYVFNYNGYSFPFNPWKFNIYSELLTEVNKIVKKDKPRRKSKLHGPVSIIRI